MLDPPAVKQLLAACSGMVVSCQKKLLSWPIYLPQRSPLSPHRGTAPTVYRRVARDLDADDVIDSPQSDVIIQSGNRMHAEKGLLVWMLNRSWIDENVTV